MPNNNTVRPATAGGDTIRDLAVTGEDGAVVKSQDVQLIRGFGRGYVGNVAGARGPLVPFSTYARRGYEDLIAWRNEVRALRDTLVKGRRQKYIAPEQRSFTSSGAIFAPSLLSLNFPLGDTAGGGQSLVLTGLNLAGATLVTVGGSSATITGNTSTTVTVTLPAGAQGVASVSVTTAGGTSSLPSSFEYWTPAQLTSIDAYLDAAKGITLGTGTKVTAWLDQTVGALNFTNAANDTTCANQIANVFGTVPAIRFVPQQYLNLLSASVVLSDGYTVFAVLKWTATTTTNVTVGGCPLTLIGDGAPDAGDFASFGASAGTLRSNHYVGGSVVTDGTGGATGLNDGNVRLVGASFVELGAGLGVDTKFYVGASQQGTTSNNPSDLDSRCQYGTIGNAFGFTDGWQGDVGAIVVLAADVVGGELPKLNQWAQQRFGTP